MGKNWRKNYTKKNHCDNQKALDWNILREEISIWNKYDNFFLLFNYSKEISRHETAFTKILTQGATDWFNYMHSGMCQNTFPKSKSKRSFIQIQSTWWKNG